MVLFIHREKTDLVASDMDCLQVAVINSRSNCLIRSICHILKIHYLEPITLGSTNETLLHFKRKKQNNTM